MESRSNLIQQVFVECVLYARLAVTSYESCPQTSYSVVNDIGKMVKYGSLELWELGESFM